MAGRDDVAEADVPAVAVVGVVAGEEVHPRVDGDVVDVPLASRDQLQARAVVRILRAARALKSTITGPMADGLLTAIAMDTGWFRHPLTSPTTLGDAAELVEAGAKIDEIYRLLFERNTLGRLKMMGETLAALETDLDGRIAYASVTKDDLERTGAIPADTEDLVDFTVSLRGVEVGLLFIEQKRGGVKLSVRSRAGFDCARLASRFGGGGHKAAAGATLPDPLAESVKDVLDAVKAGLAK